MIPFAKRPTRTSSPLLRAVFARVDASGLSGKQLSRCGYHEVSISKWKHGTSSPSIQAVESLAAVVGCSIGLVERDGDLPPAGLWLGWRP